MYVDRVLRSIHRVEKTKFGIIDWVLRYAYFGKTAVLTFFKLVFYKNMSFFV